MSNFGAEVRRARLSTGVSIKQLSEFTGKGVAYHSGLEMGSRRISWDDVCEITIFFRSNGYPLEFKEWYNLAREANNLPLRDFKKEIGDSLVFDCPAGRFNYE